MLARSTHASALAVVFSKSLDRRRQRLSQASVRSTTQLGRARTSGGGTQAHSLGGVIIDSQSVKSTESGGPCGFDAGKKVNTGWGANRELATSWPIGPEEDDKGEWLDKVLGGVGTLARSLTFSDQLRAIREQIPWLTTRSTPPELVAAGKEP
jgi:hypothetical protein